MTREEMVKICQNRDKSYTGKFFLAVKSTKIVCNPECSSKVPLEKTWFSMILWRMRWLTGTGRAKSA